MSSSEDDMPLSKGAKSKAGMNGFTGKSLNVIPKSLDRDMDRKNPSGRATAPGISIRNGPVDEMDVDVNPGSGAASNKRRSRNSTTNGFSYKEQSDDEDEVPLSKKRRISKKVQDDESDDAPIISKKAKGKSPNIVKRPPKLAETALEDSEDSDIPLGQQLSKEKHAIQRQAAKEAKAIRREEKQASVKKEKKKDESDDDTPIMKKKAPLVNGVASSSKKSNGVKKEESDDDAPLSRRAPVKKKPTQKASSSTPKKKAKSEEAEDIEAEEDEYRWWENQMQGDGTKKWTTLQHSGVVFPPPYEPLPKNVKMRYDGVPIKLALEAEEVAGFFGTMLSSTHNVENPTFQKNFFDDFKKVLKKTGGATDKEGNKIAIEKFEKCDFQPMFAYYEAERERKKALPAAEKKQIKAEKEAAEAPYMYCLWDGRKQKVGNFRVEPPGLFRGRGEHPKTGRVKQRVMPEQITVNIGKEATVPAPPEGHRWKEIKHDNEGTWLAMWQENINSAYKYVMLAANSDIKGQSDYNKFEKARELKKHIDGIRQHYTRELKDEVMANRQRATAMYLIDEFALRAGNEKGDDEAETVGCCSLKFEHITLRPPNTVIFDFLGKDSIRFYDEVKVTDQVFKNLKIFKKAPKGDGDDIFDRLTTSALNKHLSNFMPGLTAKVFRTYNASFTMAKLLKNMRSVGSIPEKIKDYNEANKRVAILCNHKRTVAAGHGAQMEKLGDRIKGLKYQKWRVKQMMLDLDAKAKKQMEKKHGSGFFDLDGDIEKEWVLDHQKYLVEEQRQKIQKKFEKENEKLKAEGEREMKAKELEERLKVADELAQKFKKENKKNKVEAEGKGATIEKYEGNLEKLDQRIATMSVQAEDKESNKEVALGTSKINYIDPRLTVVFSKKFDVPIEKFFSKTLREKFDWAIKSVEEDWEF